MISSEDLLHEAEGGFSDELNDGSPFGGPIAQGFETYATSSLYNLPELQIYSRPMMLPTPGADSPKGLTYRRARTRTVTGNVCSGPMSIRTLLRQEGALLAALLGSIECRGPWLICPVTASNGVLGA